MGGLGFGCLGRRLFLLVMVGFSGMETLSAGGIFFTNRGQSRVEKALYDGTGRQTVLAGAGSNVRGLALDLASGKIYYADNGADVIYRMNLDGTSRVQILLTGPVAGTSFPADVRLNLAGGHLYFCDQQKGQLRRCSLDGSNAVVLLTDSVYQPYYLDLDLNAGKIYWGDFDGVTSNTGSVFRANLDGSGRETVVTGNLETRGVCVDPAGGMLYWVNRNAGTIHRCPLSALPVNVTSSPAVQTLYSGLDTPHGLALDVRAGKIYWADTGTNGFPNTLGDKAVSRGDMDGSGALEVLVDLGSEPWDVEVDPRCRNFAEWTARHFRKNPGSIAAATADPDNDGVVNAMECATGMHPLRSDAWALPVQQTWRDAESGLHFPAMRYLRRTGTADLATHPQHSFGLADWWDETSPTDEIPRLAEVSSKPVSEDLEEVVVRSIFSMEQHPRQFLRLQAVLSP